MSLKRLYNLDYLRGLAALGIMIYHYSSWTFGRYTADTFMGRLGIYGVAIFYVLSGLTLFHVYHENMTPTWSEVIRFFKKRVFRIFPLLWLVTIIAILIGGKTPDFFHLFLNLSGLFGFFMWDVSFSTGVWSIGNELVFYTFFPFFIYFSRENKLVFWLMGAIIFLIFLYFAFVKLHHGLSPVEQTSAYFNPLNNLFLFFGGFLIGKLFHQVNFSLPFIISFFLIGFGLFIFYPAYGNRIDLLTGVNRLVFTFSCMLICIGFYKVKFKFPRIIHEPFVFLGDSSYSLYLLHPLVFKLINVSLKQFISSPSYLMLFSIIGTLIISHLSYNYFEKFFMEIGKRKLLTGNLSLVKK